MINVKNQAPISLIAKYPIRLSGDYNPIDFIKQTIASKIFSSQINNNPVEIDLDNTPINEDDLTQLILEACQDTLDVTKEDTLKELFSKTLLDFTINNQTINKLFVTQAATIAKLPDPLTPIKVNAFQKTLPVYKPDIDIIPNCKKFLSDKVSEDTVFASFAYTTNVDNFAVYFKTESDFNDFKTFFKTETQKIINKFSPNTQSLLKEFDKVELNKLTESLILRNDDTDNNEEYSFARTLITYLMYYQNKNVGIFPFSLMEFFNPLSIVFINIERHAHATKSQIELEWEDITRANNNRPKIISKKSLRKLTTVEKQIRKLSQKASSMTKNIQAVSKIKKRKFPNVRPANMDIYKAVVKILKKQKFVNQSHNVYKKKHTTFQKANRRHPNDFNKPGVSQQNVYKPDIHIYADTSGSISEENYADCVRLLIKLAKKLNVDLYFNSFSHVISSATKLKIKDRTAAQIYNQIQRIDKVSGGTDFNQVWTYINDSNKRKEEISIMITDFEYSAPNKSLKHPKNLYYVPVSKMNWDIIKNDIEYFTKSMSHIDPLINFKIIV